ncbi:MAG: GTP cyclohydrolase II RibA [bacterium]|nr:GTP cyclohydrolase II RibA [bacterium]
MAITETTVLHLKFADFTTSYHKTKYGDCLSFSLGDVTRDTPIVRIHSACLFGEVFYSLHCDCGQQIKKSLQMIKKHGSGVIVYTYAEGRGIGIENKIKSMETEMRFHLDTVEAFSKLGFEKPDLRDYTREVQALKDLKLSKKVILISNNPQKIQALTDAGYRIKKTVTLKIKLNEYNSRELFVKKHKLNYLLD